MEFSICTPYGISPLSPLDMFVLTPARERARMYTVHRNGLVYEGRRLSERRLSLCVCVSKFVTHVISRPSGLASCSVVCSWIS